MADTISLVIPYYNYLLEPFKLCIESIHNQIVPFDEVVISDFGSTGEFKTGMEALCKDNGFKYIYTPVNMEPKAIVVYLWLLSYNIGIQNCTKDLIMVGGTDRIYEDNTVRAIMDNYQIYTKNNNVILSCGGYNLDRMPFENESFEEMKKPENSRWRMGQAWTATSREWWNKIRGFDEKLRWYADVDILRRMNLDGGGHIRIHKVNKWGGEMTSCVHVHLHGRSIKLYGGEDVKEMSRSGKRAIHRHTGFTTAIRNDETWGKLTKAKIERVKYLMGLGNEKLFKMKEEGRNPFLRTQEEMYV